MLAGADGGDQQDEREGGAQRERIDRGESRLRCADAQAPRRRRHARKMRLPQCRSGRIAAAVGEPIGEGGERAVREAAGALQAAPRRDDAGESDAPRGAPEGGDHASGEDRQHDGMEPAGHGAEEVGKGEDEEESDEADGGPQRRPNALPQDGETGKTQAQHVGDRCVRLSPTGFPWPLRKSPGGESFALAIDHAAPRARSGPLSQAGMVSWDNRSRWLGRSRTMANSVPRTRISGTSRRELYVELIAAP